MNQTLQDLMKKWGIDYKMLQRNQNIIQKLQKESEQKIQKTTYKIQISFCICTLLFMILFSSNSNLYQENTLQNLLIGNLLITIIAALIIYPLSRFLGMTINESLCTKYKIRDYENKNKNILSKHDTFIKSLQSHYIKNITLPDNQNKNYPPRDPILDAFLKKNTPIILQNLHKVPDFIKIDNLTQQ